MSLFAVFLLAFSALGGGFISTDSSDVPPSGVTAGTYGSGTTIPVLAIGADGRITTASHVNSIPYAVYVQAGELGSGVIATAAYAPGVKPGILGTTVLHAPAAITGGSLGTSVVAAQVNTDVLALFNEEVRLRDDAFSVGVSTLAVKDGKVGIGTTSPSTTFNVLGATFAIASNGNIGIGITNPTSPLDFWGRTGATLYRLAHVSTESAKGFTAYGWNACSNAGGIGNTCLGFNTAPAIGAGAYNTYVGFQAAVNNTASNNTAIGRSAMQTNSTGGNNTCLGDIACFSDPTGSRNTTVGHAAMYSPNAQSSSNTAVGYYACGGGDVGSNGAISGNTCIGYSAGRQVQAAGQNNVLLGHRAGDNITSGQNNIIIGAGVSAAAATSSGTIKIGPLISGSQAPAAADFTLLVSSPNATGQFAVLGNGDIGIGTTQPTARLTLSAGTTGNGYLPPQYSLAQLRTSTPTVAGVEVQGPSPTYDRWIGTGTVQAGSWLNGRLQNGPWD